MNFLANLKSLAYRVLWTVGLLGLMQLGTKITLPGIDGSVWLEINSTKSHISFFALYITPYILANILIFFFFSQTSFYKKWNKVSSEKTEIFMQMMTLFFSVIQGSWFFYNLIEQDQLCNFALIEHDLTVISHLIAFYFFSIFFWSLGTTILQWFAHLISKKGLGNGITLIIVFIFFIERPFSFLNNLNVTNEILFFNKYVLFVSWIVFSIHFLSKKTIQNSYILPLTGLWSKNRLKDSYKKNLADLGGGTSQLHGFYFSFQSISFFVLIFSNFLHQFILFFLKQFTQINTHLESYYFLELFSQLYAIWTSIILIIWFFYIFTHSVLKESIYRFLQTSHHISNHLNPRQLGQTIFKENQDKIKKLFIFFFFLKITLILVFFSGFFSTEENFFINSIDRMSIFLLLILRIFYSVAKQIQSKYWWDILRK